MYKFNKEKLREKKQKYSHHPYIKTYCKVCVYIETWEIQFLNI